MTHVFIKFGNFESTLVVTYKQKHRNWTCRGCGRIS